MLNIYVWCLYYHDMTMASSDFESKQLSTEGGYVSKQHLTYFLKTLCLRNVSMKMRCDYNVFEPASEIWLRRFHSKHVRLFDSEEYAICFQKYAHLSRFVWICCGFGTHIHITLPLGNITIAFVKMKKIHQHFWGFSVLSKLLIKAPALWHQIFLW